jgi:hypothetical protein
MAAQSQDSDPTASDHGACHRRIVRFAEAGDRVEWSNHDRRGVRKFEGVVIGDSERQNTHVRVRTEKGNREVRRAHLRIIEANTEGLASPAGSEPPKP